MVDAISLMRYTSLPLDVKTMCRGPEPGATFTDRGSFADIAAVAASR